MSRKNSKKNTAVRKSAKTSKVVNSRKQGAKVATASSSNLSIQKLEKEVLQGPAALVRLLNSELSSLKKKEKQLKADLLTSGKNTASATQAVKTSHKNATTNAGKKQLVKAKKTLADAVKFQAAVAKQYNDAKKSLDSTAENLAKMVELSKHLGEFSKIWAKKLRDNAKVKAQAKAKAAAKAKAKKREAANKAASTHDSSLDFLGQPSQADFETPAFETDAVQAEEIVESNS